MEGNKSRLCRSKLNEEKIILDCNSSDSMLKKMTVKIQEAENGVI